MLIERKWAMPNKWTFTIKPIKELLAEELKDCPVICDPFAGFNSPGTITNDLNKESPSNFHIDALEFLRSMPSDNFDAVLYDPPYSPRQVSECYKGLGIEKFDPRQTRMDYWSDLKNECVRILKLNGTAICFGWNSMGLGLNRGCEMRRILLVPHGGSKNDTIVTVEMKIKENANAN